MDFIFIIIPDRQNMLLFYSFGSLLKVEINYIPVYLFVKRAPLKLPAMERSRIACPS